MSQTPTLPSPFLHWAKTRPAATYDLGGSNLAACTLDEFPSLRDVVDLAARNDNGYPPLVEAIAAHYGVATARVVTAVGCSGANFLVIATLVEPGDEVLIEQPAYDPLIGACRLMGASIRRLERRFEDRYAIDPDDLRRQITSKTKLLILTSPHNPSGVRLDANALRTIGDIAASAGTYVLVDEVYLDAAQRVAGASPTAPSAAHLGAPFVITNSLTKSYGLAGLRSGWVIAPATLAEPLRRTRDVIDNANPAPPDLLASAAFNLLPEIGARARDILSANLQAATELLSAHPALEVCEPPHASVIFPRVRGVADSSALVQAMAAQDIAVAPGTFFETPAHFRIGLGGPPDRVSRSLHALSRFLAQNVER